jgi:CBS domain-containing protein
MTQIEHAGQTLPAPFATAHVEDAMSPGVISCPPETPLRVVARMMATFNVHSVFVFEHRTEDDEDTQLWGVVSDLDLVAASRLDVDARTAGASAVTPIVAVRQDAPLLHAADLMAQHGVSHLAVVEPASGRPIGVVSTLDIARAIAVEHGERETQPSA